MSMCSAAGGSSGVDITCRPIEPLILRLPWLDLVEIMAEVAVDGMETVAEVEITVEELATAVVEITGGRVCGCSSSSAEKLNGGGRSSSRTLSDRS